MLRTIRCCLPLLLAIAVPASATELKKPTADAFQRYSRLTETRLDQELRDGGAFLWIDRLPAPRRAEALRRLRAGEVVIDPMRTRDAGKDIEIPDGIVHHWMGTAFIPGVTLRQALALVQDYDRHKDIYKPDVTASRLLRREGNDFHIFLRFTKHKVVTVVMNTEHDVHYVPLDAARAYSRSYSTRIAEVEDPGEPTEREKPPGEGGGFLWGINSFWRFQEKDGGVYVQCEAISLTRGIPMGLGWLIRPFITGVPRELLLNTLSNTRKALVKNAPPPAAPK